MPLCFCWAVGATDRNDGQGDDDAPVPARPAPAGATVRGLIVPRLLVVLVWSLISA